MGKNEFFTTSEAAKILGISRVAVFNRIKKGKLKAMKIGRNFAIPKEELEDIIGGDLNQEEKEFLTKGVQKVIREYGETLQRLGKE